jgi:hypothetical protein
MVIFGKRRGGGDDSEPRARRNAAAPGVEVAAAGPAAVDESQLPRWRRPSLQQVRRADPLRAIAETSTMSFATAGVRPLGSYERRQIRYRLVRLLNCPDEVRASEIGVLDRGDEVQLLERHGVYWRVMCPDGRAGWVHRMTLAAPVLESESAADEALQVGEQVVEQADEPPCEPDEPPVAAVASTASATSAPSAASAEEENVDGFLEACLRARGDSLPSAEDLASAPAGPVSPARVPAKAAAKAPARPAPSPAMEPVRDTEAVSAVGAAVAALARDYLERAGFAVVGPDEAAQPVVERAVEAAFESLTEPLTEPLAQPVDEPSPRSSAETEAATALERPPGDAVPAAEPVRVDGRYSGRKSAGSRKVATASRPGTRSRRPSR